MTYIDTKNIWKKIKNKNRLSQMSIWAISELLKVIDSPIDEDRVGFIRDEDKEIDLSDNETLNFEHYWSWVSEYWEGKYQDPCDYPVKEGDRVRKRELYSYRVKAERVVSPTTGDRGWKITFTNP